MGKKKERAEAVMKRMALEGQQWQVFVLNTWHNHAKDVRLTKQKKEERAQAVLNKYAMEGNMMLQLIVQTWGSDTKMEVMGRELRAKQEDEMRAQQVGQKEER